MFPMKLPLVLSVALFLAPPRGESVALRFEPEEGTVLKRTFVAEAQYRLADASASIDGEELPREGELPDSRTGFTEHISVRDTLSSLDEGRVTELVRQFVELGQDNTDSFEGEEASVELASPLEGRSVRFTWDADEQQYEVEAADEGELDPDVAACLRQDLDLLLLLPDEDVALGDEWELDPELYLAFMWPSGLLDFHAEGEEPSPEDRAPSLQTIEKLAGSGTAKLEELREEDGVKVAVIHIEMELTTGSDSTAPASDDEENPRPEIHTEVEIERTLEGTILWDLEHGHAHSAALECQASRLVTQSWTLSGENEEGESLSIDCERSTLLEGTIRYTATIERE
jgi:hypothetical protein